MIRSDVIQTEDMTALDVQAAPAVPVRNLNEVLDQIVVDATANAAEYLQVTKVPFGGE